MIFIHTVGNSIKYYYLCMQCCIMHTMNTMLNFVDI